LPGGARSLLGNEVLVEAFPNLEIIATEEFWRYILNIVNALRKRF
jgi:hypothetical protein